MKKIRKLSKSIVAAFLALLMFFSLPSAVYAYIGAVIAGDSASTSGTFEHGEETFAYLQNEFIHFDICVNTSNSKNNNLLASYAHTLPTATMDKDFMKPNFANFDAAGAQRLKLMRAPAVYDKKTGRVVEGTFTQFQVSSINWYFDKTVNFPYDSEDTEPYQLHGDLVLKYNLKTENSDYDVYVFYSLVKLNEGSTTEPSMDRVNVDPNDTTINWGVMCKIFVDSHKDYMGENETINLNNETYVRMDIEYESFAKTGHDTITADQLKNIAVNAQVANSSNTLSGTVISNGVSKTAPNTVTEVYCDSYGFAAPFVATSYRYGYNYWTGGVEGHSDYYPESIEFSNNTLKTYGKSTETHRMYEYDGTGNVIYWSQASAESSALWGFRGLMMAEEVEQQQITPDKFDIAGDAQYLAVFPDGNKKDSNGKQIYKVIPAATTDEIAKLAKTNGTCVAQYRGKYAIETDNSGNIKHYRFNTGAVAISPSITATWDNLSTYFRLKPDGTPEFEQGKLNLNSPTFKFYDPKDGGGLTFDGYDAKLGAKFGIKPDKNNAYISINLPGNSVQVKGVSIDTKGNIVFTGKFKMNLFVAQMEMLKLGYGLNKKSEFICNGVHAKGKLKVPKAPGKDDDKDEDAKPNVLGFGGASMEGEVNTFPGEELYDFKFELTVKNLFSTKAELSLVRLKNGSLCPEHLYFELKSEVEGAGIDLTPATPAVTITGGGGGIDGLASTIDGNYTCIPPVVLTLVTYGQVIKVVDGKLTAKIGPSILRLEGTDLGFKVGDSNLEIVDSIYAGIFLTGKEITYGTTKIPTHTYRGVTFGGELGIGIKIFNFKDDKDPLAKTLKFFNNTINANASLGLETYAGSAIDAPKWMYIYIGAYGSAGCSLNIPSGVPAVGGKKLAGASLDFKLGAQTAFETGNGGSSAKQFFKNASLTGAIAASGYVWPVYGRIIYVLPKTVHFEGKLFKELDPVNWDKILYTGQEGQNSNTRTMALSEPEIIETEDGEQAIAYASANIAPVRTKVVANNGNGSTRSTFSKTVTLDSSANIPTDEKLVLAIVPKDQNNIDAFAEEGAISCDKISTFNWVPDVIPETDTDPGYNIWRSAYESDDEGNVLKEAIYISLTKEQALANDKKTVITAPADFEVRGMATTPVTKLNSTLSGTSVTSSIENPETEKQYALYTYFGTKVIDENGEERITSDYLVDGRDFADSEGTESVSLNTSGDIAPTGQYYVTSALVEKTQVEMENEDGSIELVDAEIPVSSWVSDTTYNYVNTSVPTNPTDVNLELIGNESMRCSWKKSFNTDGYKLTIYQKDGDKWVDTERGFTITNEEFEEAAQGLEYDEATETYSIDIAMTVGGSGEASSFTSSEGDEVEIDAEAAEDIKALEAGKTYKVGVKAFKTKTVKLDGETGEDTTYDEYSEEAMSNEKALPVYKEVKFDVNVGGNTIEADDEGLYNATVNTNGSAIEISNITSDNADVSENTDIEINQVGLTGENGEDIKLPLNESEQNVFTIPEFDGTISLEVSAKYIHDGVTDETLGYIYVSKDNIAPVISFDSELFFADDNGSYTLTGMTEPGAKVKITAGKTVVEEDLSTEGEVLARYSSDIQTETEVFADENGAFTFSDTFTDGDILCERDSTNITAVAYDELNNESAPVSTIVSVITTDLSTAEVSGITAKTYTGEEITQDITLTLDGTILSESAYDVEYENNINVGIATLRIVGKGIYTGQIEKTFSITKADITPAVTVADWTEGDEASVPEVTGNLDNAAVTFRYKQKDAADSTYSTAVPTLCGRYTVEAAVAATSNCNSATATADFRIFEKPGDHHWGEWTVITPATCTETGTKTRTCTECGATEDGVVDALGHDWGDWTVITPAVGKCSEPGTTAVEQRSCARCDATETRGGEEVDILGHDYIAAVTEPTCTEGGYTTYTCSRCEDTYTGDETAPLGHEYAAVVTEPTCTEGGYTTYTCSRCGDTYTGDETEALGHTYGEEGEARYTCTVCKTVDEAKKAEADEADAKAEAEAADEAAAASVKAMIYALPAADKITTADKAAINAARDAYNKLTDAQKTKIDTETLSKLNGAETALAAAEKAEADKAATNTTAKPAAPATTKPSVTPAADVITLTLKKAKIKKSAKKIVIQATLKINGKAVRNKKVTFKVAGIKFTAKTNKKGVAKLKIKGKKLKKLRKKLKVGKKVKYQATYGGKTVKKSVKVKK